MTESQLYTCPDRSSTAHLGGASSVLLEHYERRTRLFLLLLGGLQPELVGLSFRIAEHRAPILHVGLKNGDWLVNGFLWIWIGFGMEFKSVGLYSSTRASHCVCGVVIQIIFLRQPSLPRWLLLTCRASSLAQVASMLTVACLPSRQALHQLISHPSIDPFIY